MFMTANRTGWVLAAVLLVYGFVAQWRSEYVPFVLSFSLLPTLFPVRASKSSHVCVADPLVAEKQTVTDTAESVYEKMIAECAAATEETISACLVPRVVHIVWVRGTGFKYYHFLAVKSMHDRIRPDAIYIHGLEFPTDNLHFKRVMNELGAKLVKARNPDKVFDKPVMGVEHQADVIRLETLIRFGGIYMDTDVFVLKSVDEFLNDETVMPLETTTNGLNNGIIFAKRCSRFLQALYEGYRTFNDADWGGHSILYPHWLYKQGTLGIRAEPPGLIQSEWPNSGDALFAKEFDPEYWEPVRIVHGFSRAYKNITLMNESEVIRLDNNYGRIARNLLAGKEGIN